MKIKYFGIIICLLFISCVDKKKDGIIENEQDDIEENIQGDSENDIIYGDGYWQYGKNRLKVYEISSANEFRSKLSFYKYYENMLFQSEEQVELFKLDVSLGSIIYTTTEYLIENSILNETLAYYIIDVLMGYIKKEGYFSQIEVYFNDIYYGRFLFYYNIHPNQIRIQYYKAEGIDTYFHKHFTVDDNNHILSNEDYDANGLKKMNYLCKLYHNIIVNRKLETTEDFSTVLGIDKEEIDLYISEFQIQKDYNHLDDLLLMKIKELFNYSDEISIMIQHIIIKYINLL
jgi:hypothetical protein